MDWRIVMKRFPGISRPLVLSVLFAFAFGWHPLAVGLALVHAVLIVVGQKCEGMPGMPFHAVMAAALPLACQQVIPADLTRLQVYLYLAPAGFVPLTPDLLQIVALSGVLFCSMLAVVSGLPLPNQAMHIFGLLAMIVTWVSSAYQKRQITAERDRFRLASQIDSLTGLFTMAHASHLCQALLDGGATVAAVFIDLNDFKRFNDTFGHLAGNRILIQFANAFREEALRLNRDSIPCRLGGDEFMVFIPCSPGRDPEKIQRDLAASLAFKEFVADPDLGPVRLQFAVGMAVSAPGVSDVDKLMHAADLDMYGEKYWQSEPTWMPEASMDSLPEMFGRHLRALAEKDMYTFVHSRYVAKIAAALAVEMDLPVARAEDLRTAGWLHDLGKILVPAGILRKPGALCRQEYDTVKRHVDDTLDMLEHLDVPPGVPAWIRSHHERWDGEGYPHGVAGTRTPLEARILQVADAFSAMTLKRVYRSPVSDDEAVQEIRRNSGTQFDPRVVEALASLIARTSSRMDRAEAV